MPKQPRQKIVVVGGGTGTSVVLSGLKNYPLDLTAIITVADSGGSTGRLRDEFGFLAVGDLRQALGALALEREQAWIRELLLYRFAKGNGLEGHNLGNLILTALQDMTGSTSKAIEIASQIFRLHGHIYPVTTQKVDLVVEYEDGTYIIGEHHLNPQNTGGKKIKRVHLSPRARLYRQAKTSLEAADVIILGPGDLYASIMPNLIVSGIKPALKATKAKVVYIVNLMTSYTQTHGMTAREHIACIEKAIGRKLDYIVVNREPVPDQTLKLYAKQHEFPVAADFDPHDPRLIQADLLRHVPPQSETADKIVRSFLRHDHHKLAQLLVERVMHVRH